MQLMLHQNFNLTEGLLYRSPLRLLEDLQGEEKRSWDLGYHHAIRHHNPDDSGASDKEAYAKGFESGRKEQPHPTKNTWTQMGRQGGYLYGKDLIRPMLQRSKDAAVSALRERGINVGKRLGAGGFGEVFSTDKPGNVVKLDMSGTEHRVAKFIQSNPALSGLPTLPKIHDVVDTGVIDPRNGIRIHAIHREDVHNIQSYSLTDGLTKYGDGLNEVARLVKEGGMGREDALQELDRVYNNGRESFFDHDDHRERFDQVHKDIRKLVANGVVPCDLRGDNWGERHNYDGSTNVVMRDIGCFSVATESGPFQLDSLKDAHLQNPKSLGALSRYLDVLHTSYPGAVDQAAMGDDQAEWASQEIWHDPAYLMKPDPSSIGKFVRRVDDSSHFVGRLSNAISPGATFTHDPDDPQGSGSIQLGPDSPRASAHILTNLIKHHYPGSRPRLTSDESGHQIDIDNMGKLRSRGERLYRTHRQSPGR